VGFTAALFLNGLGSSAASRWELLRQGPPDPQRVLSYRLSLGLLPGSGWFGHGAGTFSAVFPNYDPALNGKLLGFWKFAHEDYLQTVIEYGWLGAAVWAVFLFGSLGRALWRFGGGRLRTADRLEYGVCLLALLGVALHSLIDFPLQIASLQLLVMIYAALAWAAPADEPRDGPEPKTSAAEP
jgi:O-antigen ligase